MNITILTQQGGHTTLCKECAGVINYTPFYCDLLPTVPALKPTLCESCHRLKLAAQEKAEEVARLAEWEKMVPALYHTFNPDFPGGPSKEAVAQVIDWQFDSKGLIVFGPPGSSKTITAYNLTRRLKVVERRSVAAMHSSELDRLCRFETGEAALRRFERLSSTDVLFIDDLCGLEFNDSTQMEFYSLLEYRTSRGLPCLFTCEQPLVSIQNHFHLEYADRIARRLKDFCTHVSF